MSSDARRKAEEALAKWEDHRTLFVGIEPQIAEDLASALRALLAEPAGETCPDCGDKGFYSGPDENGEEIQVQCRRCFTPAPAPDATYHPSDSDLWKRTARVLDRASKALSCDVGVGVRPAVAKQCDELRGAILSRPLPLPPGCTHDPSLVCLRCRDFDVTTVPAPAPDAVREAAEEAAEALAAYNSFDRDHSTVIADQCAEALRTLLAALAAAKGPK